MTTASELVNETRTKGQSMAKVGKTTLYVAKLGISQMSVQISAPLLGTIDASEALTLASDLMACTHLALECERLLTEKGYVIWRDAK